MTYQFSLGNFLKQHRFTIIDVVFLSLLESLLFVAQFYFIGKAINDLLKDAYVGLYILVALFAAKVLVSYVKQKRISKAYKNIYEELIIKTIGNPMLAGEATAALSKKNIIIHLTSTFFKGDLIKGFETIVRLILVLIMLLVLNKSIFFVALGLAIIVFLLYFSRKGKTKKLSLQMADLLITEEKVLKERDQTAFYSFHHSLEKLENKLLGISAINLSIIELLTFAFLIISIIVLVREEGQNALGTFFTLLYYVMAFSEVMFLLPSIYQKYIRMQELSKKLNTFDIDQKQQQL